MRASHLTISVLFLVAASAPALAAPGGDVVALAATTTHTALVVAEDLAPSPADRQIQQVRELADGTFGEAAPPAPPVVVPELQSGSWIGPLALAGLGAVAVGAALFLGGARFVTPAEVLQNDVRRNIYTYLRQGVGANLKQITDDLRLTTTNAIWHLRKLEDAGLIHSRRFNGYKIFYPAEGGIEARRMSLSMTALQNANAQEVFEFVVGQPGTHQREIARALHVNHGTVRWHLKKLMDAELITETRRGKTSAYFPTETGLAALSRVARSPRRLVEVVAST